MAEELTIQGSTGTAKVRHPVAVPVLSFITLGIYGLYWWYQVNREMVDLGRARGTADLGDNPTTSLLAWFPGGLIIVPFIVSVYNGVKRMQRAQEITLGQKNLNGWIVLILIVVGLSLVAYGYMQSEMNKVWESEGAEQIGAPAEAAPPLEEPAPAPPQPSEQPPPPPPPAAGS